MKMIVLAAFIVAAGCVFAEADQIAIPYKMADPSETVVTDMKVVTDAEWNGLVKRLESIEATMVYLKPLAEMRRKARETAAEKSRRRAEERLQAIRASEATRRRLEREQGLMDAAKPRIPQRRKTSGSK